MPRKDIWQTAADAALIVRAKQLCGPFSDSEIYRRGLEILVKAEEKKQKKKPLG
ncbi:hypothetical protein [Phosphitispora fastidiosa]|uniref:hypothetical protein n=1 Tax=Phosphitispora fastidiosa TaxID=2837202 RepID=UPI001E324FE1|nr:hypothetical protein [Phosphitispora fastidiosa]MBU7006325.1 hypothetical protein [Phosphitispora fastidiosa]